MTFKHILPLALLAVPLAASLPASAADTPKIVEVTGEVIDTWCYVSGVMGGPEVVTGSTHHTCALWCAAGGIPVGLLADDGTVYMVLKINGEGSLERTDTVLEIASHEVTAKGEHYLRDGINYIVVENVIADAGITNLNHLDYGSNPGFSAPKPAE
ncbi:MAG: hypothetical protein AAGA78_08295 [Pseudomonadota bacterium]